MKKGRKFELKSFLKKKGKDLTIVLMIGVALILMGVLNRFKSFTSAWQLFSKIESFASHTFLTIYLIKFT